MEPSKTPFHRISPQERAVLDRHAQTLLRILATRDEIDVDVDKHYWSTRRDLLINEIHEGTALCQAARWGALASVAFLISINRLAPKGLALADAATAGHAQCVEALLCAESARYIGDDGRTALTWAIENNHPECVRLLAPLSDPKHRTRGARETAIEFAVELGHGACADLLAPWSDPQQADTALKALGAHRMPKWAARREAEALAAILFAPGAGASADEPASVGPCAAKKTLALAALAPAAKVDATPAGVFPPPSARSNRSTSSARRL